MNKNKNNSDQIDINSIIHRLLQKNSKDNKLKQIQIRGICTKVRELFLQQPILLQLQAPLKIVGDIHGQYSDLIKIFDKVGYPGNVNYLFLGDYVDRGKKSLQCITLLFAYKIKYPQNIFLLRGNHQCASINRLYGFYDQCKRKYNIKLWKIFSDVFNCMPVTAIIDQKIFCIHGGLSPQLKQIQQITKINRPTQIPQSGLLCDLLWSDPQQNQQGFRNNQQRGISKIFGQNVVKKFNLQNDIDLIVRAHQVVQQGYEFYFGKKLVTVFSATNYCGQFDNSGAVINVDQNLTCSFDIIHGKGHQY